MTWAVAAGSTRSANTSSDPVIWLVSAAASPSSTRNATDSARTGTPRPVATSGSTDANSSGRPSTANAASASAPPTASSTICPGVMPRKLPNSRLSAPLRLPSYSVTKRNPQARANAYVVPMTADSSLYAPCRPRGTAAMTRAAARQNAK